MFTGTGTVRSRRIMRSLFAFLLTLCISPAVFADAPARPANWATAVAGVEGMGNLFQVSPELYRSRQPSADALKNILAQHPFMEGAQPIRTIVELLATRDVDGDVLRDSSAVHHEWLKFSPFSPKDQDVLTFLRIVTDKASQPVLVHCAQGSDRTGMMVAIYRIVVQGWSKEDALNEMVKGGYGFHPFWQDLVRYVQKLDVDALKMRLAQAGPWQNATDAIAQNAQGSSSAKTVAAGK
jgi:protein tyrosine/serine phosphatase